MGKFRKNLEYFSPEQIQRVFEKNREIYIISTSWDFFTTPRPINFDNKAIIFEELIFHPTLSSRLLLGEHISPRIFFLCGRALNVIHTIGIHGDFVTKNIFYNQGIVTIFDIEPPGDQDLFDTYFFNEKEIDLGMFIFSIITSHFYTQPLLFWKSHKSYIQDFLRGYEFQNRDLIKLKKIKKKVWDEFRRWRYELKHGPIKNALKALIVFLALMLHIYIYKIFVYEYTQES